MPSLPIPMISALVLGFLLLRILIRERGHGPLVTLLALAAAQGLIISLAQHYGVPGMATLQPLTASLIPPMAWVAFRTTAVRAFAARDYVHLLAPASVALCLILKPDLPDLVIPALFLGYGAAIIWFGRRGADALPRMRLEAGDLPGRIWQVIGAALIVSAFSDVLIVLVQVLGVGHLQPWIISLFSSGMLLLVGSLSLSNALAVPAPDTDDVPEARITDQDVEIVAKVAAVMAERKLYLNPDLTLTQLSRKLLIPVKQLSGAINRVTGENVSRYINAARIGAAKDALMAGESVTGAMLSSGFNTKSNFNREFLRVTGQSPSDWLQAQT